MNFTQKIKQKYYFAKETLDASIKWVNCSEKIARFVSTVSLTKMSQVLLKNVEFS